MTEASETLYTIGAAGWLLEDTDNNEPLELEDDVKEDEDEDEEDEEETNVVSDEDEEDEEDKEEKPVVAE